MKNTTLISLCCLFLMALTTSSCSAIASIFKAGMGFGAFAVIAIVVIMVIFIFRLAKGKNN